MSKERELLESCLDEMQYHNLVCPELKIEIKELLAQPEQPTREPLDLNKVLMSGTGNGFEYIDGFTDGVLYAEKYHCIGGADDE